MRVYLIRHGRPEIAPGICYGSADLTVAPQEHARVLSALLPLLSDGAPVFSSPLRRCNELAAQLAAALGSGAVMHDRRLAEMHFGAWEMRSWEQIPRAEIDAWARNPVAYRPGGGESVLQVARRVRSFHDELQAQQRESAVVVCHAGVIRLLFQCRQSASPAQMARQAAQVRHSIEYGELLVLDS